MTSGRRVSENELMHAADGSSYETASKQEVALLSFFFAHFFPPLHLSPSPAHDGNVNVGCGAPRRVSSASTFLFIGLSRCGNRPVR